MQISLIDFKEKGLLITWKLIEIGFCSEKFFRNISIDEILEYALDQSIKNDDSDNLENYELVNNLAFESKSNIYNIERYVSKLAEEEKTIKSIEDRKWRVVYVAKNLVFNNDYLQGLIELTDLWALFDFPNDSPHIVQGKNNMISPEEYYTQNNYSSLFEKTKVWIEEELCILKKIQIFS